LLCSRSVDGEAEDNAAAGKFGGDIDAGGVTRTGNARGSRDAHVPEEIEERA
jgi:hypothetical protein